MMYFLAKDRKLATFKGNYFLGYLFWYSLGRTILEPLRIEKWEYWGMPVASLVGMAIMCFALAIIFFRKKKNEWKIFAD